MKISADSIQILKNFSTINSSICIQPGNLIATKSPAGGVFAVAQVAENFDQEIAIFDLPQFLNVWSTFNDPELHITNGKQARIVEDKVVAKYTFAEPSLIPKAPREVADIEPLATFHLKGDQLNRLIKTASAMGLTDLIISGDSGDLKMTATVSKSVSSNSFENVVGQTDNNFKVKILLESIKNINLDYFITVTSRYIKFEADCEKLNIEKLTYWVAIERDVNVSR